MSSTAESSTSPKAQDVDENGRDMLVDMPSDSGRNEDNEKHGEDKESSEFRSYARVFAFADRYSYALLAIAFVCAAGAGTMLPLMDVLFGQFVNVFNSFAVGTLSPAGFRSELNKYTLFFVYLFIGKFALSYIWTLALSVSALRTTRALRIALLESTLRQNIAFFDQETTGNTIAGLVTTSVNLVNHGISEKLGLTIAAISTFVTAFIVAFIAHWKLTLIIIGIVPVNIIVTMVCVYLDTQIEAKVMGIQAQGATLAQDVFGSIRTVHAFWGFARMKAKFQRTLDAGEKEGMKKSLVYAVMFSIEFFLIFCGYALAFWQGIRMFVRGEIESPGKVVTVIFVIIVAAQALTQVAPQLIVLSKAAAAADELFRTIDRKSEIDSLSPEGVKPDECDGDIELKDVKFSYPSRPNIQVLKGLSLRIPAKKTTALVGPSGSGKSTIVGLIERWYNPLGGSIELDGRKIEDLNLRWLRTQVRVVQQEPTLFSGTILENVAHGLAGTDRANLPPEEKEKLVKEACEKAFASEFIEHLPKGYSTRIGERGASLSGGQKQRIAIARSIISDPSILLLDEATSALDPNAEKIVQKALNNVAEGRTMIVIAHRLSTIRNADNIVVMKDGAISEQGTHDELISMHGIYANLVQTQDLGRHQGSGDEDGLRRNSEEEDKKLILAKTLSQVASNADSPKREIGIFNYDLVKCVYLVIKEHPQLWKWFALTVLVCAAAGATYPALAVLFSRTMKVFQMSPSDAVSRGDFFSLMFFIVALGNCIIYCVLGVTTTVIGQSIYKSYRGEVFSSILGQKMAFFDQSENTVGALVSRLATVPNDIMELLAMNLGLIAINIFSLVSSCILAIVSGWKLGLVLVLGALPPLVGSGYLRIRIELKLDSDTSVRFAESAGIAAEAVMAIRTVASLAMEKEVAGRFKQTLMGIARRSLRSLVWMMFWYSLSQSIQFLAMALGFWYGGRLMSTGEYSTEQFYIVFVATIFSGEMAAMFFTYGTTLTKAVTAINWVFNLRASFSGSNDDRDDSSNGVQNEKYTQDQGTEIQCQNLVFSYPLRPSLRVLRGIDAAIPSGSFIAFVGPSGCGKTTMISLLERFYDPVSGDLLINSVNARNIPLKAYRQEVALVQQEPVLYQGSIRENIAMGAVPPVSSQQKLEFSGNVSNPAEDGVWMPSDEAILEACEQANIRAFIESLPDGLATACGSQGLHLSGGQRQRIAIARALIRKPRLLLLDEATSALDGESEKIVKAALDKAARGEGDGKRTRTTVAVAHRLSTVRDADKIYVFVKGKIVESGTHDELLELRGVYYEMCKGQALDK